jgi:crossover junction endodeoxyribonuclease RusA
MKPMPAIWRMDDMNEIKLVLPYPPSANRYWRSFVPRGHQRAIVTVSDEAKSYKKQVGWMCKAAGIKQPITGRVEIDIQLYPKRPQDWAKRSAKNPNSWDDDVQCLDLDNVNKVLFDAIKGIAIDDDKWIRRLTSERMEPDGEARVVVTIRALQVTGPQASLL